MKIDITGIENFDGLTADELRAWIKDYELPDNDQEISKLRAEYQKKSNALDKVSSELTQMKKNERSRMSAEEQAKADHEKELSDLKAANEAMLKELTIGKYTNKYLELGYEAEAAGKIADAQFSGDTEAMFKIMAEYRKSVEAHTKSELMKNSPRPDGAGAGGDGNKTAPNLEIAKKLGEASANVAKQTSDILKSYM